MNRSYNYKAFTPEEVEQGLLKDLLDYLTNYSAKSEKNYYDIHITTDGYCTIVEWVDINYDFKDEEGKFEFVPADGYVMIEKIFPDNHTEMCFDEEDYKKRLNEFLEKNPGWVKTYYGTWTNEEENKHWKEYLANETGIDKDED